MVQFMTRSYNDKTHHLPMQMMRLFINFNKLQLFGLRESLELIEADGLGFEIDKRLD